MINTRLRDFIKKYLGETYVTYSTLCTSLSSNLLNNRYSPLGDVTDFTNIHVPLNTLIYRIVPLLVVR